MLYFYKCTKIRSISIKHIFLFVTQNEQNRRENVKIKLIFIPYMPSMMFRVFLRTLTIRIFCVKSIFGVSRFFVALARLGCGELLFFSMCVHPTFVLMQLNATMVEWRIYFSEKIFAVCTVLKLLLTIITISLKDLLHTFVGFGFLHIYKRIKTLSQ